tara:strand:- start:311 stop:556 length:246 start_codon:yes stop_codon:yes gene_type:complete
MVGLFDLFTMRDRINNSTNVFYIIFEKASILISLLIIMAIGLALDFPMWGVAVLVGLSLGPVVYGHYYLIYIRPLLKERED